MSRYLDAIGQMLGVFSEFERSLPRTRLAVTPATNCDIILMPGAAFRHIDIFS
jgi:hypothetical protein